MKRYFHCSAIHAGELEISAHCTMDSRFECTWVRLLTDDSNSVVIFPSVTEKTQRYYWKTVNVHNLQNFCTSRVENNVQQQ